MGHFSGLATRVAIGHKKKVSTLCWNCEGSYLAAGGDMSCLRIFDSERLFQRDLTHEADSRILSGHNGNIEQVVASPIDPFVLASIGADKLVNLYDLRAGSNPVRNSTTEHPPINIDWSPDGKNMIVGDREDVLYLIEVGKMNVSRKLKQSIEINQMRWNRTGSLLLLACGDGGVQLMEWPSMVPKHTLRGHRDRCFSVAHDPTGQRIAVTSDDTCVTVWSATTLNCQFAIDRAEAAVRLADYSHDGQMLATGGISPRIDISAAATGGSVHVIATSSSVVDIQWHPKRHLLAYCCDEDIRRPVSAQGRPYVNTIPLPKTFVYGYPVATSGYVATARQVR